MDFYIGFLFLLFCNYSVNAQTTVSDTNTGVPSGSQPPPPCPDLMCTMEFIPDECREQAFLVVNGVMCSGCPKWKQSCIDSFTTSAPRPMTCPDLICKTLDIPKECEVVETYDYNGITCKKCPIKRADCPTQTKEPQIACPLLKCKPGFNQIPEECIEIPYYSFMGRNCTKCPVWREGCQPSQPIGKLTQATSRLPEFACPLFKCDVDIPAECRVKEEYTTESGRICSKCPTWREGCREQERISSNGGLLRKPMLNQQADVPCPNFPCPSIFIPAECREEQPFQFNGKTCFRCPLWRTGCDGPPQVDRLQPRRPEIACPLFKCDLPDLPRECFLEEMFQFQGKMCHKCPLVKVECRTLVPPRPIAVIDPTRTPAGSDQLGNIACPLQACPLIYIPQECREIETFQFRGKTCQGCPRFKPGCLPLGNIPQVAQPTEIPQIPQIPQIPGDQSSNTCPEIGCPFILIPVECREQPTYDYNGMVCNHCPRWREGCVPAPSTDGPQTLPPECPVFDCERLLVHKDCIEIPTISIRGRNCTTCPRYKEGCQPNRPVIDQEMPGPMPSQIPLVPSSQNLQDREMACPLVPCTRIFIPPECRQETPYQFQGKTCYKCPKWIDGCVPGSNNNGNTLPNTPVVTTQATPVDKIACPLMRCNKMFIHPDCREETPYVYMNSKICYRCPRRKEGCVPGEKSPQILQTDITGANNQNTDNTNTGAKTNTGFQDVGTNNNVNTGNDVTSPTKSPNTISELKGVLPVDKFLDVVNQINCPPLPCPAVYIPTHCQEMTQYVYQDKLCNGCPRWRQGCSALGGRWENSFDGLLAYNFFRALAGFGI